MKKSVSKNPVNTPWTAKPYREDGTRGLGPPWTGPDGRNTGL